MLNAKDRWDIVLSCPIDGTLKAVLSVLAHDMNKETEKAITGVKRMAERSGLSERTVHRSLKALQALGFLKARRRYRPVGGQTSNEWTVDLEAIQAFDPASLALDSPHAAYLAPHVAPAEPVA